MKSCGLLLNELSSYRRGSSILRPELDSPVNFSRRPIRLHLPCCGCVCEDELLILSLIGACQSRNHSLSRRRAEWLVSANGIAILLEGGQRIASALQTKEIELPNRPHQNDANTEIGSGALSLRVVASELVEPGTF